MNTNKIITTLSTSLCQVDYRAVGRGYLVVCLAWLLLQGERYPLN